MKRLINRVKRLKEYLDKEVCKREQIFLNHSEKWQDSEAADLYSVDTENLRYLSETLDESLSGLE